jgi:hypothetical protein
MTEEEERLRKALEPFASFFNLAEDAARMGHGVTIDDQRVAAWVGWEGGNATIKAKHLREARDAYERPALSAPPAPVGGGEWPGIDTAPRDGSWFVARQNGEAFPCQWVELEGEGWVYEGGSAGWLDLFNSTLEEPAEWQGVILGGPDPKPAALSSPPSQEGLRAEIVRLLRSDFDPAPPNHMPVCVGDWNDNAEEVADAILALPALAALSSPPLEGRGFSPLQSPAAPCAPTCASGASPADGGAK